MHLYTWLSSDTYALIKHSVITFKRECNISALRLDDYICTNRLVGENITYIYLLGTHYCQTWRKHTHLDFNINLKAISAKELPAREAGRQPFTDPLYIDQAFVLLPLPCKHTMLGVSTYDGWCLGSLRIVGCMSGNLVGCFPPTCILPSIIFLFFCTLLRELLSCYR